MLPLRARLDLGAIAKNGYSAFPKAGTSPLDCLVPVSEHSLGEDLTPLQRNNRCIIQLQLTAPEINMVGSLVGWFQGMLMTIYINIYTYIYIYINAASNFEQVLEATLTKHPLYGHLPTVTKTIQVRRTKHAWRCWRSRDELISDVLLWTPSYSRAKAERPDRTYIQQLCEDTGCSLEDQPEAMNDWKEWRERVRDISASGTTWLWWYIYSGVMFSKLDIWPCATSKQRSS